MRYALLFALLCFFQIGRTQNSDLDFAQYLMRNQLQQEAIFVLKSFPASDSVNYFLGENYFQLKQLDSASLFFSKVTPISVLYEEAGFKGAFSAIYLKNFDQASASLNLILTTDPILEGLKNLNLAGIALLERNFDGFEAKKTEFDFSLYQLKNEEQNLVNLKDELLQVKSKSPLLAGVLSAVIPGAGKVYAGKWKQGLAYFGIMTALGLQWYESYKKRGIDSPYFYFYGSAFTLFYIGNIWGSALSVQIEKNEQFKSIDNQILVNLQLPLRTVFQ